MSNAKDADMPAHHRILLVGPTGSGKTAQIWSLPGRKFAYIFDPNSMRTIRGCDVDYELWLPEIQDLDITLKGFNKGSRSDKPARPKEPKLWTEWGDDVNKKYDSRFFDDYDWIIFDSLTFLSKAAMGRQLYINGRYGDIEELADYRVVGSKLSDVFSNICSLPLNILATGHFQVFQDEKTKKLITQIRLPGSSRDILPLVFTDVWMTTTEEDDEGVHYLVRTKPEPRGLQDIRCSISGLDTYEDVTIKVFSDQAAGKAGIGALLHREDRFVKRSKEDALHQR